MARVAWKTASESWPKMGNRELVLTLDFTNAGIINDDLSPEMQLSEIESIQSIFIDNSLNTANLSITFYPSGQSIQAQAFSQGVYPVICWGRISYQATTTQGVRVPIILSNVPKPYFAWGPAPGITVTPAIVNKAIDLQPAALGDNTLIAGIAGQQIRVYRMILSFAGNCTIAFYSGTSAGTLLFGHAVMFAGGSITMEPSGAPWLVCAVGQGLDLNLSAATNVGGMVSYVQS